MNENCQKEWNDHWQCLEMHNQQFYMCRKPERAWGEEGCAAIRGGGIPMRLLELADLGTNPSLPAGTLNQCVFEKMVSAQCL